MIDFDVIQEIENYLETPVIVKSPTYYEVVDPVTDELLATVEWDKKNYQLRVDGDLKIIIPKT